MADNIHTYFLNETQFLLSVLHLGDAYLVILTSQQKSHCERKALHTNNLF